MVVDGTDGVAGNEDDDAGNTVVHRIWKAKVEGWKLVIWVSLWRNFLPPPVIVPFFHILGRLELVDKKLSRLIDPENKTQTEKAS